MTTLDWILVAGIVLALVARPLWRYLLVGLAANHKPTVRTEVHAMLELAIKQNACLIEIRDLLGAGSTLDLDPLIDAMREVRDAVACGAGDLERMLSHVEKVVALLGQLRDYAERAAEERKQIDVTFPKVIETSLAPFRKAVGEAVDDVAAEVHGYFVTGVKEPLGELRDYARQLRADSAKETGPAKPPDYVLRQIEQGEKQLEALGRLDQRLFEFVQATKGIMRAIGGDQGEDDDILIENAKMIRAQAADRGIDISLEDAIKRAREKAVYNRG